MLGVSNGAAKKSILAHMDMKDCLFGLRGSEYCSAKLLDMWTRLNYD